MARTNHRKALATAVAKAFLKAGFSSQDLLSGQIVHTGLDWMCPPLHSDVPLDGYPLDDYLTYPIGVKQAELLRWWRQALVALYASPTVVIDHEGGWKNLRLALPSASLGERALRFSLPPDYPKHGDYDGHLLTMEVVNVLLNSTPVSKFENTLDDYYVVIEGAAYGIADGKITGAGDEWNDVTFEGLVETYSLSGRGKVTTSCHYDIIAKVRSVLHENADEFEEFAGIDWALQALRKLSQHELCVELITAVEQMVPNSFEAKRKIRILDEAIEMFNAWTVNDRVKLTSMFEMLVPTVLSATKFYTSICDLSKPLPAVLGERALTRISTNLDSIRNQLLKGIGARERVAFERK